VWQSIRIRRFRGFEEFELAGLGRVNLIGGRNNVGKTNLLEALFLHSGGGNPELALRLNAFRGLVMAGGFIQMQAGRVSLAQDLFGSLFYRGEADKPFEIVTTDLQGTRITTRFSIISQPLVSVPVPASGTAGPVPQPAPQFRLVELGTIEHVTEPPGQEAEAQTFKLVGLIDFQTGQLVLQTDRPVPLSPFLAVFLPMHVRVPVEDASRLANLIREGREQPLTEALRVIEPRLRGLLPLPVLGVPIIHVRLEEGPLLPLAVAGEGMERLARILLAVFTARDGVVLVDEVEAGFHHSVLKDLWKVLAGATAQYQVQLFATTHDWETVVAAHEAFSELEAYESFRYIRLDREDGRVRAAVYEREDLQVAIERGLEVR
jgi:hypothetical protein